MGRPDFLDIAVLYVLINFVSTIGVLKFFRYRDFSSALSGLRGDAAMREEERKP
jgi:multicomponent Na+:H+ antiporter subunit F